MKKILLCGINARFSHSNLAILCLRHAAKGNALTIEFSINDSVSSIVRGIVEKSPDAVGFSCYIWNIEHVLKAASSVKKVLPDCFIFLGGPEVSYGSLDLIQKYGFIDMIIKGPGEVPFAHFAKRFISCGDIADTPSACVRTDGSMISTGAAPVYDLSNTPFMYEDLSAFENKVIYYETSRGCPFGCAYCMSANEKPSFLPMERVKAELEHFIKAYVRQVKFVDRTFNFPPGRAYDIIETLIRLSKKYPDSRTNFHLEITASLLDADIISLLRQAKKGLIRLEAGVQSTNPQTLKAVNRCLNMPKLLGNLKTLCEMDNIHVHADLIAGLPLESYETFKRSFNDVYALQPDALQLGFLKVLKGSPLPAAAEKYGIVYTDYAPYEVLRTNDMTYEELSRLHTIEQTLNLLYNSRLCRNALRIIIPSFASPFDFYVQFADRLESSGFLSRSQKTKTLFERLHDFSASCCEDEILKEALLLDWLFIEKPKAWPGFLKGLAGKDTEAMRSFLSDSANIQRYLPHYAYLSPRELSRRCTLFTFNTLFSEETALLFDYGKGRGDEGFCRAVDRKLIKSLFHSV
jgi:radical SAM superfamily enzyme YgiQ (UPF0313 family)